MVSAKPWNIVVENGRTVKVTYNGEAVTSREDNDTIYYQITNTKVYSLPQSGGPGTPWIYNQWCSDSCNCTPVVYK